MKKAQQKPVVEHSEEKADSLPLKIQPIYRVDRLERVKEWIGAGHAPKTNVKRYRFPDKVAAIVSKTYAECGDGATLSDDIALIKIRDLLLDLDEGIIDRNKRKKKKLLR